MNIHEYQAKEILKSFGTPVLNGYVVSSIDEAIKSAEKLGGDIWVVKAQIHAGGRGKAGGVKVAKNLSEVESYTKEILGKTLVTPQTGPEGKEVLKVYIEQGCNIRKEYYIAFLVDRTLGQPIMMASSEGGMDIEEVAKKTPEKIHSEIIEPIVGLTPFQARKLAFKIGMKGKTIHAASKTFLSIYKAFISKDASMIEINPLVETTHGDIIALDGKMNFDSNALYRHPEIMELRDLTEEEPSEIEASKHDLAFIKLDGNIGCLVNGAGLAMATMDIIKLYGGEPANFLDVGGGANKEKVTEAFKLIINDKNVKGILINIFGGILKCDVLAEGVIAATQQLKLEVPLVVRLAGTNVEKGKQLLEHSGLNIIAANDLNDAARKIVTSVKENS